MGKYLEAAERLSDHLWLLRGVFDRPARHRLACALAAEMLGCHAPEPVLTGDTNGKPKLNAPLGVSLSYRDGLLLVGLADTALGVDVEWIEGAYSDVARDQFPPPAPPRSAFRGKRMRNRLWRPDFRHALAEIGGQPPCLGGFGGASPSARHISLPTFSCPRAAPPAAQSGMME